MLVFAGIIALAIFFSIYVRAEKDIDNNHKIRLQSYKLADELRQSSDTLTRMVRSYVATSDPIYKQYYHQILAIRDGKQIRPASNGNFYWDLVLGSVANPPLDGGQKISLLQRMQQAEFTQSEFAKLAEAKESSDVLTNTEIAAMQLIENTSPLTELIRAKAILMLHDRAYNQAKTNIMQPISMFNVMANQRTLDAVDASEKTASQMRVALILLGVTVLWLLWRAYQAMGVTLGTSLKNLHAQIEKIGHGDFQSIIPVDERSEGSIIALLSETQLQLANFEREHKQTEGKLERMAHYDVLTNMPNRVLLADRLGQAMVQCQRRNRSLAVAFLDLDGFKVVNDNHGHSVGDKLLIAVSKRMKDALREGDTLARIGGDEFITVMVDLENAEDSVPALERLLKAATTSIVLNDEVVQVSASIGVAYYPQDGLDADQLIRRADQAMYGAKQSGKNRYHQFDIARDNAVKIPLESISDIRLALDRSEFVLHYQPKVNMRTGDVIGVEALIRWKHPVRGLIPPLEFLPMIENHAIGLEISEWVIGSALSQISRWQNMGINIPTSVNISAHQLQQSNFATRLAAVLADYPEVTPHCLELQMQETSVLSYMSRVSATMNACHELGVRFALDNYGTGYSSLNHLRHLPTHMINIDQSFVRDMLDDANGLATVKGVVGLAKVFQRNVIAEGVETIAQGVALLQLGCELAQGYGIARPMPAGDIPDWISNWKADDSWQLPIPNVNQRAYDPFVSSPVP